MPVNRSDPNVAHWGTCTNPERFGRPPAKPAKASEPQLTLFAAGGGHERSAVKGKQPFDHKAFAAVVVREFSHASSWTLELISGAAGYDTRYLKARAREQVEADREARAPGRGHDARDRGRAGALVIGAQNRCTWCREPCARRGAWTTKKGRQGARGTSIASANRRTDSNPRARLEPARSSQGVRSNVRYRSEEFEARHFWHRT